MFSLKKSLAVFPGLLVIIAVFSALVPLVGRGQGGGGNPLTRDSRKSFYLTKTTHDGSQALTACADGYHMASLWEILDPSNMRYDTQLGATLQDSGFGPPVGDFSEGWIRTGGGAATSQIIGLGNCNAWMSARPEDSGTVVKLDFPSNAFGVAISPWFAFLNTCNVDVKVWCVQD